MRYGHQQYSEILEMPVPVLYTLVDSLGEIISRENDSKEE